MFFPYSNKIINKIKKNKNDYFTIESRPEWKNGILQIYLLFF